jgi:E3 ubiquitin-protein ligase TRIP12
MLAALAGVTSSGLSATTTTKPPDQPEASTSSSAGPSATVERRRSQRLSAKSAAAAIGEPPASASEAGPSNPPLPPASLGSSAEPPTSLAGEDGFGDNAEFTADFTDDDVEAEVFDDEMDPDNVSTEKTVTLSVADGSLVCFAFMSRVLLVGVLL